jgi:hypothetical protein
MTQYPIAIPNRNAAMMVRSSRVESSNVVIRFVLLPDPGPSYVVHSSPGFGEVLIDLGP